MFDTLQLQYLNKLVEGEVGDFTPPKPFHALKVQGFNGNRIKNLTKICRKLPMKVFALICDFPTNVGASSASTLSGENTWHYSSHTAICPYSVDVATYGNIHALATYRQASCQDRQY